MSRSVSMARINTLKTGTIQLFEICQRNSWRFSFFFCFVLRRGNLSTSNEHQHQWSTSTNNSNSNTRSNTHCHPFVLFLYFHFPHSRNMNTKLLENAYRWRCDAMFWYSHTHSHIHEHTHTKWVGNKNSRGKYLSVRSFMFWMEFAWNYCVDEGSLWTGKRVSEWVMEWMNEDESKSLRTGTHSLAVHIYQHWHHGRLVDGHILNHNFHTGYPANDWKRLHELWTKIAKICLAAILQNLFDLENCIFTLSHTPNIFAAPIICHIQKEGAEVQERDYAQLFVQTKRTVLKQLGVAVVRREW